MPAINTIPGTREDLSKNSIYFFMKAISLFVCIALAGLYLMRDPLHSILIAALFTFCLIPWLRWKTDPHFHSPIYVTSILLLLSYPIRVLMLKEFPDMTVSISPNHYSPADLTADTSLMTTALYYSLIGIGAYVAFYYVLPFEGLRSTGSLLRLGRLDQIATKIIIIYAIGWTARYYQISTANFSPWFQGEGYDPSSFTLLKYLADLCEIAYIGAWVLALRRQNRGAIGWAAIGGILITEVIFALTIQGQKSALVRLALFPLLVASVLRGKIPLKSVLLASLVTMYFIFPFVQAYRDLHQEVFAQSVVSIDEGMFLTLEAASGMYDRPRHYTASLSADTPVLLLGAVIALNRFPGFDSLAIMITHVPTSYDFIWGSDLVAAPLALIPRAIWPEKPLSQGIQIFDREILASEIATTSPYPVAEGYLNGGIIGILFVMFTTALFQRGLYSLLATFAKENPLGLITYVWFYYMVINIDSWVLPIYAFLLQKLLVFGLVWLLFIWKIPPLIKHTSKLSIPLFR